VRVLAIGAHPDDIELGCGGTLALFNSREHEVYALVLTRGEASGDPLLRQRECEDAAKIIGVKELFFGDLEDTKITEGIETIMVIERILGKIVPDIVFSHSHKDGHQDHRNCGFASLSAARNCRRVLLYESPAALRDFCPQVFVDITSTFHIKRRALGYFYSQGSKPFLDFNNAMGESRKFPNLLNVTEGQARFRGFQAGVLLAEAFEVGKYIMEIQDNKK